MKKIVLLAFASLLSFVAHGAPCTDIAQRKADYYLKLAIQDGKNYPSGPNAEYVACEGQEARLERVTSHLRDGGTGSYDVYWFRADCGWTDSEALLPNCGVYGE